MYCFSSLYRTDLSIFFAGSCPNSHSVMFKWHWLNGFIVWMRFTGLANQGFILKTIRHLKRNNAQSNKEFVCAKQTNSRYRCWKFSSSKNIFTDKQIYPMQETVFTSCVMVSLSRSATDSRQSVLQAIGTLLIFISGMCQWTSSGCRRVLQRYIA